MLEHIQNKLKEEATQRALLQVVGATAVFVTGYVINKQLKNAVDLGIDALMEKWHPTTETPAQ